ncbi:hypothetical protein TMatcc_003557 [Talaromyces marneffei ATCC 18224]
MRVFQITALPANGFCCLVKVDDGREVKEVERDLKSLAILTRFDFKAAGATDDLYSEWLHLPH